MRQFEQDWLELGRRVACSLHYQHPGTSDSSRQPGRAAVGDGVNDQDDPQQPREQ
jgi:hypothetical protein